MPSNLATMQQQILRLFQTVLDASITDVDFSIRVQAHEQAPSLQKFDFQLMKISFEFVEEKQFAEVLYPQNMYDLIDFSLRKCVQEKIMMLRSTHHCCTVPLRRRGSYCQAVRFIIHLADRKVQRHWTAMCHFQPYSAHTAYGW